MPTAQVNISSSVQAAVMYALATMPVANVFEGSGTLVGVIKNRLTNGRFQITKDN
jgi:hypothetical protein